MKSKDLSTGFSGNCKLHHDKRGYVVSGVARSGCFQRVVEVVIAVYSEVQSCDSKNLLAASTYIKTIYD